MNSRYYNPEWSRFINADSITGEKGELLSHNMFAYRNNDPVDMEDRDVDIAWWVGAGDLRAGDKGLLYSGKIVEVEQMKLEKLGHSIKVYNFEVDDWHTYFVSKSNVLVHNTCGMNNLRTLNNTIIKGYKVSMDLERGGSGLTNMHLKVEDVKYFYKSGKFISSEGKEIPKALRNNATIQKSLNKALDALKRR